MDETTTTYAERWADLVAYYGADLVGPVDEYIERQHRRAEADARRMTPAEIEQHETDYAALKAQWEEERPQRALANMAYCVANAEQYDELAQRRLYELGGEVDDLFPIGTPRSSDEWNAAYQSRIRTEVLPLREIADHRRELARMWAIEAKTTPPPTPAEELKAERDSEWASLFVDVGAVLDGNLQAPQPTIAQRSDGAFLFYAGAHNGLTGDPEAGKSLIALSVAADVLFAGGSVLWVDLDHNGAASILARFRAWGVQPDTLRDPSRFCLVIEDDREHLEKIVGGAARRGFDLVVVDSIGELLGLYGASPDSDQEFTQVNRAVMAKLAQSGACVISIDHLAKGHDSRSYGATGTVRKKAAMDGAYYRVEVIRPFAPGHGGKASLKILKDRHGGVREVSPRGERAPEAATFELIARGEATDWRFWEPGRPVQATPDDDVTILDRLDPKPSSVRDVKARLSWSTDRATAALRLWRQTHEAA
jgi:hypothetical protein